MVDTSVELSYSVDWEAWNPSEVAVLCFVFDGDQVLLIEKLRGLGKGKVNGPGGRLEPGETAQMAAIRETQEEVGIIPIDPQFYGRLRFAFTNAYHLECHVFRADAYEGVLAETPEAIPFWASVNELPFHRMWADDEHWLPHLVARRSFEGRFIFNDDAMLFSDIVVSK
jgi:8-oxo-dGTP diphosphatase